MAREAPEVLSKLTASLEFFTDLLGRSQHARISLSSIVDSNYVDGYINLLQWFLGRPLTQRGSS